MGEKLIYIIYVDQGDLEPLKYLFELKEPLKTQNPCEEWFGKGYPDENNPEHKKYFYNYDKDREFQKDLKKEIAERFKKATHAIDDIKSVIFAEKFDDVLYYSKEK